MNTTQKVSKSLAAPFFVVLKRWSISTLKWIVTFFKKLDVLAARAHETDQQIRNMRAEHFAKYGQYFRERF